MPLPEKNTYTTDYIYSLPEGQRAELIDGQIYNMAPPSRIHQKLITELVSTLHQHIKNNSGDCEVYPAPFAVFLNEDDRNYVEPDISVICDKSKLDDRGCNGAPDWIIEIASPGTSSLDYGVKLFKYRTAGVREYWIINPMKSSVMVYDLEHNAKTNQYNFDDLIPASIYKDLSVKIADLLA